MRLLTVFIVSTFLLLKNANIKRHSYELPSPTKIRALSGVCRPTDTYDDGANAMLHCFVSFSV